MKKLLNEEAKRLQELAGIPNNEEESTSNSIDPNITWSGESRDRGETGSTVTFRVVQNNPSNFVIHYKVKPNSSFKPRYTNQRFSRTEETGSQTIDKENYRNSYDYMNGEITIRGTKYGNIPDKLLNSLFPERQTKR